MASKIIEYVLFLKSNRLSPYSSQQYRIQGDDEMIHFIFHSEPWIINVLSILVNEYKELQTGNVMNIFIPNAKYSIISFCQIIVETSSKQVGIFGQKRRQI